MSYEDLPISEFAFPGPLRDQLVAAILNGAKTSSTGLLREYDTLTPAGVREVVVDSAGSPVAVIEYAAMVPCRLADVDLRHAIDEGEGYESVAQWREGHERFWHSEEMRAYLGEPAFTVDDDTMVVKERFRVVERILSRHEVQEAFSAEALALASALRLLSPADWDLPTRCPPWTVKDEFAHTARAIARIPDMLAEPEPTEPVITAAQYFRRDRRFGAPATEDRIASAQAFAAEQTAAGLIDWFNDQARHAWRSTELQHATRKLTTRWGDPMLLTDFQATRVIELTVHGIDLADGLGVAPWLTDAGSDVTEAILAPSGGAALRTALGWTRPELIRKLTGRAPLTEAETEALQSREVALLTFG